MTVPHDAFRRFQEELAALDRKDARKDTPATRMERAKAEFLDLKKRYDLTIADVVAFFPEEEGIAYLQELIASNKAPAKRRKKKSED